MVVRLKVDYAMSYAINPEWYGNTLAARLSNTMIVAALLLTVTGGSFLNPPFIQTDKNNVTFRCFFYIAGIANLLFTSTIFLGVCFIGIA